MNYESKNLWNYSKYSCSKGSVGFTSVCFAVGVLSISPVPLPDVQDGMEQLFPSRDPFILGAMAVAPGRTGCPCCQPAGLTAAGFSHPHQFAPQWHKLIASVLSASLCLYTSLCSCLLSAFSVHCRFGPGTFSSFPWFAGRKQTESTASNNSHPCPIHPIENPEQHFQASLHSTSQSWNHTKQAVKIWPFKNNNSVRDRQYYRKIFPIVNFCSACVMLTHWNLIAKGL